MSLILEALKKSESQRRLGEMPNLATPVIATRKRRSLLPVLVAAIAVALAAGWWLQRDGTPTVAPTEPQVVTPSAPQPAAERRPALADAAQKPPAATPVRTPRTADTTKPAAAPPPADAVADVQTPAAQPAPASPAPSAAAAATKPLPAPVPVAGPAATNPAANSSTAPAPPVVTPAPAPPPAVPAQPALPRFWELPYATRRELPTMQLTMQVYSDDPAKRFVILNDVRQTEGAELGKGLYLREIRQDGLVMEVDGTRFFYPRGGR
ncbi:MAG: hypothetical protein DI564_06620 [Rhodanobacter denitrificans]|uniref:Type II secretion system protein GspB C-terminal domain-containing protein n=1 Tax=Rhodanobacter denitrificans TaxID=666685 RepID=A0A2W5KKD8_9GAMM|nr:MAG: hypothetical protein DI564_06620 [Rhodanobacter denitrificans]